MKLRGKLFLIPVPVSEEQGLLHIPPFNIQQVKQLKYFIVEDEKTARRNLKLFGYSEIQNAELFLHNEHTKGEDVSEIPVAIDERRKYGLNERCRLSGYCRPRVQM